MRYARLFWLYTPAAYVAAALIVAATANAFALERGLPPAPKMLAVLEGKVRATNNKRREPAHAHGYARKNNWRAAGVCHPGQKMFEDKDISLRIEDFQLIQFSPPFAAARVVQVTLPADEKDREAISGRQRAYRGNSALLPEWERCIYTQTFRKENGKWKLHLITDGPRSAN